MYYTATNATTGENNHIGVAFSNDGVSWIKYAGNPIVSPQGNGAGTYGAGQAATYNGNGQAGIYLFFTDTSTAYGNRSWVAASNDGLNFGSRYLVPNTSSDGRTLQTNADFAYDYNTGDFYAAIESSQRPGDREVYELGLFRLGAAQLFANQGPWQTLGYINSNLTGFYLNHSPGFERDGYGNLTPFLPSVFVRFAGGTDDPSTWNLTSATWNVSPQTLPFNRYFSSGNGHWVSTGYVSPAYGFEETLGYLFVSPAAGTAPLYGCELSATNHFISPSAGCEGQFPLGVNGWIYSAPQPGTRALYRCRTSSGDHFVSPSSTCEGQIVELNGQPLGYALVSQQ